jgi:hypothetical protein
VLRRDKQPQEKTLEQKDLTLGVLEYLYPGQQPTISMTPIHKGCDPKEMAAFEELRKRGAKIGPQIPQDRQDRLTLEINLLYDDTRGDPQTVPYHFEYNYRLNRWVPAGFGPE